MRFSVIVPIYKVEKYIGQCIESLLSQTFRDFELILVDDGSPDNSGKICDEYAVKDPRIKVIHKENGGLSDARNAGTAAATGEYIIYLDSDDYISTERFLETVDRAAIDDPDVVLYKYKKYYESNGRFAEVTFHFPAFTPSEKPSSVINKLVKADAFYCAAWMKAIRRELLIENGIWFKKGILSEDQEWYYRVVLCAKNYAAIDEAFIVYRQREGSITATIGKRNIMDNISLLQYWVGEMDKVDDRELRNAILNSLGKLYSNLLIAFSELSKQDRKAHCSSMRQLKGLLKYNANPRTAKISAVYNILGFNGITELLHILNKIKRR